MKSYKEMNWEELEDCADKIRHELDAIDTDINLWESRDIDSMPTPDFYSRIEELKEELGTILALQKGLEGD